MARCPATLGRFELQLARRARRVPDVELAGEQRRERMVERPESVLGPVEGVVDVLGRVDREVVAVLEVDGGDEEVLAGVVAVEERQRRVEGRQLVGRDEAEVVRLRQYLLGIELWYSCRSPTCARPAAGVAERKLVVIGMSQSPSNAGRRRADDFGLEHRPLSSPTAATRRAAHVAEATEVRGTTGTPPRRCRRHRGDTRRRAGRRNAGSFIRRLIVECSSRKTSISSRAPLNADFKVMLFEVQDPWKTRVCGAVCAGCHLPCLYSLQASWTSRCSAGPGGGVACHRGGDRLACWSALT